VPRYLKSNAETPPFPFIDVMYAFCAETKRSSLLMDGGLWEDRSAKGCGGAALLELAATRTRATRSAVVAIKVTLLLKR
jgi:hypothetical protein